MRKTLIGTAILAVALIATSAYAGFNIPGAPSEVNKAVKSTGKMALGEACKSEIKKANCRFKPNSTEITCSKGTFEQLLGKLKSLHDGAEKTVANDVNIYTKVHGPDSGLARERRDKVYNTMQKYIGYWDRGVDWTTSGNPNELHMRADMR